MIARPGNYSAILALALILGGCTGYSGSVQPSVGIGFYHSTFGHGWGGGYYRGYDDGAYDAMDTIDTIDTMDAIDSMGVPDMDMDMGPAMDLDF